MSVQLDELRVSNQDFCSTNESLAKAANTFEQASQDLKAKLQVNINDVVAGMVKGGYNRS